MPLRSVLEELLPPICTARQIAKALGLAVHTVRMDARNGKLAPGSKLGTSPASPVRWTRDEVLEAYAPHHPAPPAERVRREADAVEVLAKREAEHPARLEANPNPWTGGLDHLD